MTKHVTQATIDDAVPYVYSREEADAIIAGYAKHERDARARGVPALGSGRIFPLEDGEIATKPIEIPGHWARINGLDFGWDHPFAAVSLAWDRDADCVHVVHAFKQSETTPIIHAAAVRPWGDWIPCAWPHDGYQHDKGSGAQLADQYREQGLKMHHEHATHAEGGFGTEAGVSEMLVRMQTGRFKVFDTLGQWFEEFRLYHRKDGKIVKEYDDLLSATRIAVMMLRIAQTEPTPLTNWPDQTFA